MTSRECETCIKRKTVYCPNSIECMDTDDKPYYQNKIMLLEENQELKKKYENAVADYEATMFEKEQLRKQLEEYQLQNINLREDIMIQKIAFPNKLIKDKTFYNLYDMPTYEELLAQQKEFINYLEDNWKQTQDIWYIKILQKYKSIIGDDK